MLGCRHRVNGKCVECREGFYQAAPNSNDDCEMDPLYFCDSFLNAEKTQCICRPDALSVYPENNFCSPVVKNKTAVSHLNDIVPDVRKRNYDNCQRMNALDLLFCESGIPNTPADDGVSTNGLLDITHAFVSVFDSQYEANEQWVNYKKVVDNLTKQSETWKQLGIDKEKFCTIQDQNDQWNPVP